MDKEKLKRYFRIFDDVMVRGKSDVSSADLQFLAEYTPQIDEQSIADFTKELNSGGLKTDTDFNQAINQVKFLITSPDAKANFLDQAEKLATKSSTEKGAQAANLALDFAGLAASLGQIKAADKAVTESRRPNRPIGLTPEPLLQQQIADAQQGTFDAARRVAPAQQAIMDQYLSDLNQAGVASAGQAGTYGALAQVASQRRGRGAQALAPIIDDIKAREQGRLDNLTGMKIGENQAIQQSNAQYYPNDLYQYQLEQQAAGQLGSQGRSNLFQSLANFGNDAVPVAANFATKRRFDGIRQALQGSLEPQQVDSVIAAHQDQLARKVQEIQQSQMLEGGSPLPTLNRYTPQIRY